MSPAFAMHPDTRQGSASAAGPIVVRRTRSASIEQHTAQLQDWTLRYDQLDAGRFEGQFTDIRLPGMQLFVESTSRRVRQRGELMADALGVGTMLRGAGPLCVNGVQCDTESLVACNASELDMSTPPDCVLAGVVIDAAELLDAAQALDGMDRHFQQGWLVSMTPSEPVLARWRQLLLDAVQAAVDPAGPLNDPVACQQLHDDLLLTLIDAMAGALRDERVQRPDQRKRIVDRACELMLSHEDEPPSLFEVCRRVGASPRKLGYCFQDTFGVSPGRYIKTIRLNAVRRDLCRADDSRISVYDAAARWGFWHFGHFSADYKKLFAELPSETLNRARGLRTD
ncbi:MAG: AraC family transcriptional regulator [Burkholderiales bacterium PBB5]|nr:MAG: AraC family transcriptional regulator [Burkholderiales bacterium PBB5]